ncbi:MAG: CPBP family intramembrane metalloprotease [Candidatus Bathyarchaeota archaeon]|nr:CPBP family intramembrane metalloprotease [Candidatus Bathyarchaeota archaeon]
MYSPEISPLAAALVLVLSFVAGILAFPVLFFAELSVATLIVSTVGELMFLFVPLFYMLYRKVNVTEYITFGSLKHLVPGLGLGIALQGVSMILGLVLTYLLGPSTAVEESNQVIIELTNQSPFGTMLFLIIPGICEEFALRGFLQNALRRRYSPLVAIVGASLAFGLMHFDPQGTYIVMTFVIGLFLGYFYNRFRSYVMAATAHTTFNMMTFAILMLAS